MIFERVAVGIGMTNCYIIGDEETRDAIVVDPGDEPEKILDLIGRTDSNIVYIVLTHAHYDHWGALNDIRTETGVDKVILHRLEEEVLENPEMNLSPWISGQSVSMKGDKWVEDGDIISVGNMMVTVRHTPGHTPGSISLIIDNKCICGDALFAGSVGRTDFPGGSPYVLRRTIDEVFKKLPDQMEVWPGHGPSTTIGKEKKLNLFMK
ncbi:MBL fold metallo-hydrolase [Calorimonas adulescens]|uniref:MBL fold metallo-hydrolase n=1 Tax=Calorimonas adulescens TaxID=2606906 RepID=A0A5D8QJ26_9THEO|nr:MBL fold metallo-hydrolase [Calorimonas adulescens]TZE83503.1 MBL fold metallo-hydrolase [Calorimonas adulescens]